MTTYETLAEQLRKSPKRWLVTGVAGFIGSHLLERLLELGQTVVGIDNFATGHRSNLEQARVNAASGARFEFREGDIRDGEFCERAVQDVDIVLHQAALGSVPRSVEDPRASHAANVNGFINVLDAARRAAVRRFVYASSSSVYGSDTSPVKTEERTGKPLSPYASTKLIDEVYADVFARVYGVECVGLRYFNVFGPRQDPNGPYAAVIPRWISRLVDGTPCELFGDGGKSRDFCYVANVVQANLLAALSGTPSAEERAFNIACGERTTLTRLFEMIRASVGASLPHAARAELALQPARLGDVPHSLADIARAERVLGYVPTHDIARGLDETVKYYIALGTSRDSAERIASGRAYGA
jgi:UDP-N-acetylglucosamine 4-epimerase